METLLVRPPNAHRMLTLAHGAGAGMRHPFMEKLAALLASVGVATLRYEFPYMEQRKSRQDAPPVLHERAAAAAEVARQAAPELPLLAGGKSFGGRMTSQAVAEGVLTDVKGIVFFGFPLHPPNRPGTSRADHLAKVSVPMLFLQGTRDEFAPLDLLRPIGESLGSRATLHVIDGADHGFHVLKRSGRTDDDVLRELAQTVASWDF
ncbi:MAG TPA: alpha/beta family hydrolase [Gemmatimonadaceae bacterium]|nr:alpha/beta family hydrolase [Gemmatimonadaceae bacterium]